MSIAVLIYHTNDLHNHTGALRYLESLPLAQEDPLLLDSGDAIGGSNTMWFWDEPILKQMSALGYKAMALGNREWHYLRSVVRQRQAAVNFPLIATNISDARNPESYWQPYYVADYRGLRVGILGLSPVQYQVGTWLEKIFGVQFLSPGEALTRYLPEVRAQSDLIICLSHSGLEQDKKLAAQFPDIHIWLGGHSHTPLEQAVRVNSSYIAQAGYWGKWVGRIALQWEAGGIREFESRLIKIHD